MRWKHPHLCDYEYLLMYTYTYNRLTQVYVNMTLFGNGIFADVIKLI